MLYNFTKGVILSNISPRVLGHVNIFFSTVFYKFLARSQWGRVFLFVVGFKSVFRRQWSCFYSGLVV